MNYIYDILLNFNDIPIDFFEWEKSDLITHIKKIPIYKLPTDNMQKILSSEIKIDEIFLKDIYLKTEMWNNNIKNDDMYYCLFCDNNTVLAIKFDNLGNSVKRSYLYIDEEFDILEIAKHLPIKNINFEFKKKLITNLNTRKELKLKNYILKEMNTLNKKTDQNVIKYLYFECFNKTEANINKALNEIIKAVEINYNNSNSKLFDFFKLISINNK